MADTSHQQSTDSLPPVGLMAHLPMSEKPPALQSFGLLVCLTLACFTGFQVYLLVQDYSQSPTVLTVSSGKEAAFPDLVFCSNVPLSYTSANVSIESFRPLINGFMVTYRSVVNAISSSNLTGGILGNLTSGALGNTTGILGNINGTAGSNSSTVNATSTGNSASGASRMDIQAALHTLGWLAFKQTFGIWQETLIFSCKLANGSDCGQQFVQVDNSQYLNCYEFAPDPGTTDATFVLFSESLIGSSDLSYLFDGKFPLSAVSTTGDLEFDRASGVALYVKHRDRYMHEDYKVMASSGQSSVLTYTENSDVVLNKVSGPCLSSPESVRYLVNVVRGASTGVGPSEYAQEWREFAATKADCVLRARMDSLQARCGCRDPLMPIDQLRLGLPNCRNVSSPGYARTSACYKTVERVPTDHCYEPCFRSYYTVKLYGTKWPLETNTQAMVTNLVRNRQSAINSTYGRELAGLRYILELNDLIDRQMSVDTNADAIKLGLMAKLSSVVGSNFVKLRVRSASDKVVTSAESYQYSLFDLLGNIGGLMGLYLGWSLLSVIDLLQSVHLLARFLRLRLAAWAALRRGKAKGRVTPDGQMELSDC